MNKRFLLVAALCAAMNMSSFAQTNLAEGKTAVASTETENEPASKAFDGDLNSRWQVDANNKDKESVANEENDMTVTNGHWIYVDLGEEQDFNLIRIRWEGAYAKAFAIYTATETDEATKEPKWGDNPIFTHEEALSDFSKFYSYNVGNHKARYVKLQATELGYKGNWFSIYEMGVYKNEATATLTKLTTSADILKVGDTFTIDALDQLDQNMEGVEITATNAEKQENGLWKATAEGDIVITAVANGVTVTKTIKAYTPAISSVVVSPSFVVTGKDTPLTFTIKDQEKKDITDFTTSLNDGKITATEDGKQDITITYNGKETIVSVYAVSKAAEIPTLSEEEDLSIYADDVTGVGISAPEWNGQYTKQEQLDIEGNKMFMVTNAGTFGVQKTSIEETGFNSLNFDIFPTTDVEDGFINYEGSGLSNLSFKLKAGQWNHVSLDVTDASKFNSWIQINVGKAGATNNPNILVDNIYLSKKEVAVVEEVNITSTADAKGFYAVTGYAKTAYPINAALADKNITAYDLRNLKVEDVEMTLTPGNPNAIILVAGTVEGDVATPTGNWGDTKNLVVDNGQGYYFPVKQIEVSDKAPVYTDFFISTKSNTGYKITRHLAAKAYTTAFLPKGTTLPTDCKAYEFSADAEGNIELKETANFNANTAYVIYNTDENEALLTVEGDGDLDLTATKETSQTYGKLTTKGNYQYDKKDATLYTLATEAEDGKLKLQALDENATLAPFGAYFTLAEGTNAEDIVITIKDNVVDGINNLDASDAVKAVNIYFVDGKLVKKNATTNGLAKGVYIINGKKIVIK